MPRQYSVENKVFFYTILVVLATLSLWLVSGYLDIIVFSLVMVIILKPVYSYFERLLLGALGGYDLFGFFGVIYGPVLMVLLMTSIDVYGTYYAARGQPSIERNPDEEESRLLPAEEPSAASAGVVDA